MPRSIDNSGIDEPGGASTEPVESTSTPPASEPPESVGGYRLDELLDALYPPLCPLCGERATCAAACALHALPERPSGPRCRPTTMTSSFSGPSRRSTSAAMHSR